MDIDVETGSSGTVGGVGSRVPLLITGTPRSGASVLAQMFVATGVFLGNRFGNPDNTSGLDNWCDQDIAGFHEEQAGGFRPRATVLAREFPPPQKAFALSPTDLLVKFNDNTLWGWKDSRAVWFLDAWTRILPDAYWLFVVRRPAEIAWAAAAGGVRIDSSRWQMARQALDLWLACNRRLLDYARRYPDRTSVLLLPDDLERVKAQLRSRLPACWHQAVTGLRPEDHFDPFLLRAETPRWIRAQVWADRSVRRMWYELQSLRPDPRHAAPMYRTRSPAARSRPRIAVVSQTRVTYSETFVRSHVRDLPADVDWFLISKTGMPMTNDELPLCSIRERLGSSVSEVFGMRSERHVVKAVGRYLRRQGVEAVLAEFGTVSVRVMEACAAQGVPLVAHFHGYDASKHSTLAEYGDGYRRLFNVAAVLVVVSRDMAKQLEALGAPPGKIEYNPCSVDLETFYGAAPEQAPPKFLAMGRYVDKKAPHLTLLAFSRVLAACPEARLVMVGDGPLRCACEDLAQAMGISEAVQFVSFLPNLAIASLMRTMRGFVQHSVTARDGNTEGTPVAIMEAAASGLPIVSTRHAGIKNVVRHGQTGYLVEPGDIAAMASHWTELARDPELAQWLGRNGRAFIADSPFERSRSIARLWEIIEKAISDATARDRPKRHSLHQ